MADDKEITLREAAKLAGLKPEPKDPEMKAEQRRSNQPGASATAALEAMLGASRRGKTVKGPHAPR